LELSKARLVLLLDASVLVEALELFLLSPSENLADFELLWWNFRLLKFLLFDFSFFFFLRAYFDLISS
jgi:hypothetical protein